MIINQPITVLGADGWIGSALVSHLQQQNCIVEPINRVSLSSWLSRSDPQGSVIYTIGLTADFRDRPFDTVYSHVGLLSKVLQRPGLKSLLMLSSSRVYARSTHTSETGFLSCLSSDPSDLYNLSKLLGEALVLQDSRPEFKVVRLSNVFGPNQPVNTFLGSILSDARRKGSVLIQQPPDMEKDYILLEDVVRLLPLIACYGSHRVYNLGSGRNTSHSRIAELLIGCGVQVKFASSSNPCSYFSSLMIDRLLSEFESPSDVFGTNGIEILMHQLT